jgi:hypothetical protein
MVKKKADLTPEEYELVKKKMEAMREKAAIANKARGAATVEVKANMLEKKAELAQKKKEALLAKYKKADEPADVPPVQPEVPKQKPTPVPELPSVDLDSYFDAKYRAKSKYMRPETPQAAPQGPPPIQQLVQQTAREQIHGRLNQDLLAMAMKSVFGS